ncbi:MAG: hypothetical protein J7M26_09980, partial [Armatimonadetes bacterium]|nr:hypothetical protein [Armatimonadota bacterium]
MDQSSPTQSLRSLCVAVLLGLLATAAVSLLLALRLLPLGYAGQWAWPLRSTPLPITPGLMLTAMVLFLFAGAFVLDASRVEKIRRAEAYLALPFLLLACYLFPLQLVSAEPGGWSRAVLALCADPTTGYLTEAARIDDLRAWLSDTRRRTDMRVTPSRVATHPPGPVLFYYWWSKAVQRSPALRGLAERFYSPTRGLRDQLLRSAHMVCTAHLKDYHMDAAALSVFLLLAAVPVAMAGAFVLGWAVGGERLALATAVLASAIPGLHVFVPSIDATTAAFATWALALAAWACKGRSPLLAALAGVMWGLGLQWTFGLLALAVPLAALLLWRRCAGATASPRRPKGGTAEDGDATLGEPQSEAAPSLRAASSAAATGERPGRLSLGLALPLAAGGVLAHLPLMSLGYNPLSSFLYSMATQRHIMAQRTYAIWVALDAWDFVLFAGPALVLVATVAIGNLRRQPLLAGLLATLALLLVAGTTRGEVGRIWSFLMPLVAVVAAQALARARELPYIA